VTRATGIGSWPGTDMRATLRVVRDELAEQDLPYLPELPDRGPGADMLGRTAGILVGLAVDLQPSGWRFVDRPGRDAGRTASLWREDLDELAEAFDGYEGELKVAVAGPWTLAAGLRLHRGERALADAGACRDLAGSLAEGVASHLADVERLVPGASVALQVDEPSLPAVLGGELATASGHGRLRAVDPPVAVSALREVLAAAGGRRTVVHCCHPGIPLPLLRTTGARAVAMDTTALSPARWESVAATVEEGVELYAGCLPTGAAVPAAVPADAAAARLAEGWRGTGLPAAALATLVVSPACGLAGLTPAAARAAQRATVDVAREVAERAQA
jgi:methionine synthase II (cobalamin-independent)